jgi:hypothetical protein
MPRTAKIEHQSNVLPDLTAPQQTSNGPGKEDFLFFVGRLAAADKAVKTAKDARKKLRQFFQNQGVNLQMMDAAIAEREKEDGTTISNLRELKRYCEYLSLPIGKQFDLFDAPVTSGAIDYEQQAFEEGRELGIKGLNADDQKWLPTTPEGQAHQKGWADGQAVLLGKLKSLEDGMSEAERAAEAVKAAKEKKKADRAAKKAAKSDDAAAEEEEQPALN